MIEFEKPLEEKGFTTPCKLHFLMNNAPSQILDELSALVVYEGPKVVGKITS